MMTAAMPVGASSAALSWDAIDWQAVAMQVRRLQLRIAKATREQRWGKVKALQWLLTHSLAAKLLAVKRIGQNRGRNTAGIDGVTWKTPQQKLQAALALRRRGYQAQPLRRIYIPKKNGKQRPLSIPTMSDRAMQALYLLALEPVAEMTGNRNAYGFRPKRSTADAISQCFNALARKQSPQWILEGDIKACFDQISHDWLKANIPMDKTILEKWLDAGYVEEREMFPTLAGTPQGGIASPTLANMTLAGLEQVAIKAAPRHHKINVVIYADDFVITGSSKEVLEMQVKPAVEAFLLERGLTLSPEKTQITHISEGFDFLGFNIRKYQGKLLTKPAKQSIQSLLADIRAIIKTNPTVKTEHLIRLLNPKLRGWANYYRHGVAKKSFSRIDHQLFLMLIAWINRRHPNKSARWKRNRYFRRQGLQNWLFSTRIQDKQGASIPLDLFSAASVAIVRHIKIKADASPYDPAYDDYFAQRKASRRVNPFMWSGMVAQAE
ncbi:group II intron reverse transcriptase/maturase [Methylomicrobium lacus]|uniref:group II intron reverse transcriptase/maturase n=1 Tax=Methylomicrobium lacus TaxID=136992 RepID=UPI0035A817ED